MVCTLTRIKAFHLKTFDNFTTASKSTTFIKKIFSLKILISIFAVPNGKKEI